MGSVTSVGSVLNLRKNKKQEVVAVPLAYGYVAAELVMKEWW